MDNTSVSAAIVLKVKAQWWEGTIVNILITYNGKESEKEKKNIYIKLRVKRGIEGLLLFRECSKYLLRTKWLSIKFVFKEQHQG